MVAKIAIEPGWGHYEVFGIGRFFRDRVYPNMVVTTTTTGGVTTTKITGSAAGAYNDSTVGGGVGGSARMPFRKLMTIGVKGLYGDGTGRYGSSTIADITLRPDAQITPLHNFSALGEVHFTPGKRLDAYADYGTDYVYRRYFGKEGYGSPQTNMSGCNTEPLPGTTVVNGGDGFSPSSPSNCGNQTKNVQEFTAGYWYDFYKGDRGRFRQGLQYSYFQRYLWSGAGSTTNPGGGASGTDHMVWTSLRYYLP
jgi:hypothetical protein